MISLITDYLQQDADRYQAQAVKLRRARWDLMNMTAPGRKRLFESPLFKMSQAFKKLADAMSSLGLSSNEIK